MRRQLVAAVAVLAAAALQSNARADASRGPVSPAAQAGSEQHHYSISARVRPLALFWITRNDIGDAVVTRRRAGDLIRYSLLIGSDPDRAPLHINRWGYIEEELRGTDARLIGLMTESDEESIQEAEAHVRRRSAGGHPFKIIQGTAEAGEARSRVTSIATPENYTFHHVQTVLRLAEAESSAGRSRVTELPQGTRPGFLAALADSMHTPAINPITYVYYGRLYELRRVRSNDLANLRVGGIEYGPAVAADFVVTSAYDGEQTRFSMTYGTSGLYAELPLRAVYQPRWWMQMELTIDEAPARAGAER